MSDEQKKQLREKFSGQGNPFYGKRHTPETRAKIKANHPDFSGENNPLVRAIKRNPEIRVKISDQKKALWASRTPEWLIKHSETCSKAHANEGNVKAGHYGYRYGHYPSLKAGDVFYRSLWELYVIEQLDRIPFVHQFLMESEVVQYVTAEGYVRYSKPDFLILLTDGAVVLAEVKPSKLVDRSPNAQKIEAYRVRCLEEGWKFLLITENNLHEVAQCLLNI